MPRQTSPRRVWRIKDRSEIGVPPYSREAIEQIAAILGVTGEDALTYLRSQIEDIAARYLGLKHAFDHAPKAAETRATLAEILNATEALLERLEGRTGLAKAVWQEGGQILTRVVWMPPTYNAPRSWSAI